MIAVLVSLRGIQNAEADRRDGGGVGWSQGCSVQRLVVQVVA